jgi:ATP-dependent RNA helicase RhlB
LLKKLVRNLLKRIRKTSEEPDPSQQAPVQVPPDGAPRSDGPRPGPGRRRGPRRKAVRPNEPPHPRKTVPDWDISRFEVPPAEGQTRFHDLDLPPELMHGIADLGFQYCTPIQAAILPGVLSGSDAKGKAQTGTGKSAAFLINIYTHLLKAPVPENRQPGVPRALILAPTRELALQIEKDGQALGKYTATRMLAIFGGLGYDRQSRALSEDAVDIVAATPGRLLDFQRQKLLRLNQVEILVIDEADRMLDMGFIPDVRKIVNSVPPKEKRQTLFFGATLTPEVSRLAEQWTREPVSVDIEPEQVAAESVDQQVYIVTTDEKFPLLLNLIVKQNLERVLVFVNRRDQTRVLSDRLKQYRINCEVLSGDVPQTRRIRTLEDFRGGKTRVLVATDVAGRGLHIEGISHVINFYLPRDPEDYVHRIGRTGRAGASGISVSFADEEDSFYIPPIEKFLGRSLPCVYPDASLLELPPPETRARPDRRRAAAPRSSRRPRKGGPDKRPHPRPRPRSPQKRSDRGAS